METISKPWQPMSVSDKAFSKTVEGASISAPTIDRGKPEINGEQQKSTPQGPHKGYGLGD